MGTTLPPNISIYLKNGGWKGINLGWHILGLMSAFGDFHLCLFCLLCFTVVFFFQFLLYWLVPCGCSIYCPHRNTAAEDDTRKKPWDFHLAMCQMIIRLNEIYQDLRWTVASTEECATGWAGWIFIIRRFQGWKEILRQREVNVFLFGSENKW